MNTMRIKRFAWIICFMLSLSGSNYAAEDSTASQAFVDSLTLLKQGAIGEREQAASQLAALKHPRSLVILEALVDGRLLTTKTDGKLVIGTENDQGYAIVDALSGQSLGFLWRSECSKISLANKQRVTVRKLVGELKLGAEQPALRIAAVKAMAKEVDAKTLGLLKERLAIESDPDVQLAIEVVLLLENMHDPDKNVRMQAITALQGHNSQEVVNRLNTMVEKDENGEFLETDSDVRNMAKLALININSRLQRYSAVETVFFGLSLGAVLVLAAIGLAITFGVMGVINMAHGELMMLGAYTTYVMQQLMPNYLGAALLLSIPAAFVIAALVGMAIERGIIRFLYGRPLETLLATFGVSLILQQSVRSIFSPLNRSVATPEWMSGSWYINDFLSLTWNRFYILVFCLLVVVLLLQILKHTRLGLEVRAVAQNRKMAKAMGIPTARVDAMTFGLGSGIAGVAGVALSQITNVGPNLGQAYIVDSFMVVVFGGVGNLLGTLVAGFSLGIANKFLEPFAGAVLAKILVLVFIILFIQKRPRGLFPQKGRAVES